MIPISIKLFIMLARFGFSQNIMKDKEIPETVVKTETIVDELGKIEVILSDKTGTITQNIMEMSQINFGTDETLSEEDFCKRLKEDEQSGKEEEFAQAMLLCNNVRMDTKDGENVFNASSPDELAIIDFITKNGYEIIEKNDSVIKYKDAKGVGHEFKVIKIFPFESSRKRMGIIVQKLAPEAEENYRFFLKGADDTMKKKIKDKGTKILIDEKTFDMASTGLRTLCFCYKELSINEYEEFDKAFKENLVRMQNAHNEELCNQFENDLQFQGITGVKDLL